MNPTMRFTQLTAGLLLGLCLVTHTYAQDRRDDDRGRQEQRDNDRDGRDDRNDRGRDEDRGRDDDRDHDRDHRDNDRIQVKLTAPAPGTRYAAPATVVLTAAAETKERKRHIVRVEFYHGDELIGSDTQAPYRVTWSKVRAGNYRLAARAIDNRGDSNWSRHTPIRVTGSAANAPPTVSITTPTANQVVAAPGTFAVSANAADSDGSIAKVEFYQGSTLIGTATTAPYSVTWSNVSAGSYSLTAKATDDKGTSTTSAVVPVIVNAAPMVTLTAPAAGQVVNAPATLTVSANAGDSDGSIAKVEFYQGSTLIGTATAAPYAVTWSNVPAGSHTLTAKATDDRGAATTSAALTVIVNAPPTITLTSPTAGQVVNAPGTLSLSANATDSDGTIAKVEFYQGTTLIGSATAAPYTVTWSNVPAGSYTLTAKATDDRGATTTSAPVTVIVDAPPTIALTSPTANQVFTAPGAVTVTASTTDSDGTIAKVDFYQGTTLIGTATAAPYTVTWSNVPAGTYSLTAVATDDRGATTTSAAITIIVNAPPTVSITAPADNARIVGPATVTVSANAADADGTVAKVEFYQGTTLIGTATAAPYSITWANVQPGTYLLTAKATDDRGASTTSAAVTLTVMANQVPTIALTAPVGGQKFTAPASIGMTVAATDIDGSVARVDYFQNGNLIGTATTAPFSYTWTAVPPGSYTLTATATDDFGAQVTSAPISITVNAAGPALGMYFIHPDHLGTPRLITDQQQAIVWRNSPMTEPFGNSPPEEDPNGAGTSFQFNLRFPGQHFDRETNLNYNYFRDYNPAIGGYIQSDPIGLRGGQFSTYGYVNGNPISKTDPTGLDPMLRIAERVAGLQPSDPDLRGQQAIEKGQCELVCGVVTPGPPIPMCLKSAAKTVASSGACKVLCGSDAIRRFLNGGL